MDLDHEQRIQAGKAMAKGCVMALNDRPDSFALLSSLGTTIWVKQEDIDSYAKILYTLEPTEEEIQRSLPLRFNYNNLGYKWKAAILAKKI